MNVTYQHKLSALAVAVEACIVSGCTWLILNHYYQLTTGATVLSVLGVMLVAIVACFGLHFFITGRSFAMKASACVVWIVLTFLETVLAGVIWLGAQHGNTHSVIKAEIEEKEKTLAAIPLRDRDVRAEIRADIAQRRALLNAPAFDDQSSELKWLHARGIHVLPFPFGFVGAVLLIVVGVIKADAESKAETTRAQATKVPGFAPSPTVAKLDPKEIGQRE